ncbi:MAG TPA: PLP-dependent transferase [Planctomycetota bacterium]|nr:PLP-dependent transferase [Planctomycetota bacterium]
MSIERFPEGHSPSPSSSPETLCAGGGPRGRDGDPLVFPIVQSTSFARDGLESRAEFAYSRVGNPTVTALERTFGELEEAPPAVAFATGLAAETALLLAVLRTGDHVVCGRAVYGGTTRLLQRLLAGLGIETSFVDATDATAIESALCARTRLVFLETPANPTLVLSDIAAAARDARRAGALLAVDNTFQTAVLQRPLELGADVSVYSTTKFVEGHSAALGGALVSRDPGLLERLRFVRKSTGAIQTPFNAWLTLQGLRTLPLRLRRQSESAAYVARQLAVRPEVARVHYPTLLTGAQAEVARRQHRGAHGAVLSFELRGGAAAARALLTRVRLCRLAEHVGSVETLLTHSASMTHADVPPDERRQAGVSDGLLRLSVGLEDPEEILRDLVQALPASVGEEAPCAATR